MSRHPYTHAADFVRSLGPVGGSGMVLSRSAASRIRQGIAEAIGMDDHELACRLSDYFQANQERVNDASVKRLMLVLRGQEDD
jgi:hypothetical protein